MKRLLPFLLITILFSVLFVFCRIRSIEPQDYIPSVEGHLSPREVYEIAQFKFSKAGVKLTSNVTLNLRGIKIITDGYDSNLNVGYVYLINPPENTRFNQEYQRPLTKSEMDLLENLKKTEGHYILFINEGPKEKVEEAIDEFIRLLYAKNIILKPKAPVEEQLPSKEQEKKGGTNEEDANKDRGEGSETEGQ